jgi:hypothetical protein
MERLYPYFMGVVYTFAVVVLALDALIWRPW